MDWVSSDERDLAALSEASAKGRVPGALRALVRRIDAVDGWRREDAAAAAGKAETEAALRGHGRLLDGAGMRLAALDRTVSAQGQRIGALESLLAAEAMRRAMDRAGPVTFPIPEVRPGRAQPRTGSGATFSDTDDPFLTPPPIARAIGRAVMAAAARFPKGPCPRCGAKVCELHQSGCLSGVDRKTEAAATLSRACERIRDFWEKDGRRDGLLVSLVEGLIMATAEAKRAGVIP